MNELIRLAEILDKSPDYLTEPPERQVALRDLHGLLAEALGEAERGRTALLEALASIDARLWVSARQLRRHIVNQSSCRQQRALDRQPRCLCSHRKLHELHSPPARVRHRGRQHRPDSRQRRRRVDPDVVHECRR